METKEILERLPHDLPFVFIDRVLHMDEGRSGVGLKNVTINEPFFRGHFPQNPVLPGVFLIEGMAQLAGLVAQAAQGPAQGVLGAITDARFLRPVVPGDQVVFRVTREAALGSAVRYSGTAEVGEEPVARATFTLVLSEDGPLGGSEERE
jgi:3-hydroxyacyl-[acyl-carrier-protein] dehydratase